MALLSEEFATVLESMLRCRDRRFNATVRRAHELGWRIEELAAAVGLDPLSMTEHVTGIRGSYGPADLPNVPSPLQRHNPGPNPAAQSTGRQGIPRAWYDMAAKRRADGYTWVQIATDLRRTFGLGTMAAMRVAHQWTQRDLAFELNRRWPGKTTYKTISYWENWPSPTGHAPTLDTLLKLAEVLQCAVADLFAGLGDFRDLDVAPGELIDDRNTQTVIGQTCPHGCTVLAYAPM